MEDVQNQIETLKAFIQQKENEITYLNDDLIELGQQNNNLKEELKQCSSI